MKQGVASVLGEQVTGSESESGSNRFVEVEVEKLLVDEVGAEAAPGSLLIRRAAAAVAMVVLLLELRERNMIAWLSKWML